MVLMLERATPTPAGPVELRCNCGRYLGRWINGVLHEPNGSKSGVPVVRRCPSCGKWHRHLTAPQ